MQFEMAKCLFCGHHQVIERTGIMRMQKDKVADRLFTFTFDHIDPEASQFISIREPRGRGRGFPEIERITLREAIERNLYPELRQSLISQSFKVLKILTGEI